jgi:hypothetical protein
MPRTPCDEGSHNHNQGVPDPATQARLSLGGSESQSSAVWLRDNRAISFIACHLADLLNQMDPVTAFGVATGVIGLIPLCGQGFDFVSSVFSAKQDLNDCAFELDVERRKYIGWRTTLGLEGVPERDAPGVLKRKIPAGQHAVVLGCLVGISNAFANAKFLESCGFRQTNNDVHDGHSVQ